MRHKKFTVLSNSILALSVFMQRRVIKVLSAGHVLRSLLLVRFTISRLFLPQSRSICLQLSSMRAGDVLDLKLATI